ncbi:MAG TPA: cupredoxin domain-containing protein [Pseudolysinimonas sp.]
MSIRPLLVLSAVIMSVTLAGCVPNTPSAETRLTVAITDTTCAVSADSAPAGNITFDLKNDGSDVNEFYVLADDQERVVGEKEDVVPGTTTYTISLEPGTYYTACKFQMVGSPVGMAEFTVTG